MSKREEQRKQAWMLSFEGYVIEGMPDERGKVDWNSAIYFFNTGFTPSAAAFKYLATRKGESLKEKAAKFDEEHKL